MSKIKLKLNLSNLGAEEKLQLCRTVLSKMTGNTHFPNPVPTVPEFQTKIAAAEAARTSALAKRREAEELTELANQKIAEACDVLAVWRTYVENNCGGDVAVALSSGIEMRAEPTPTTEIGQVVNLSVSGGDEQGELDVQWDRLPHAKYYEYQTSPAADTGVWNPCKTGTASKATIKGLTSGCKIWVRVRAHGPNDLVGAWSDPAFKIVP